MKLTIYNVGNACLDQNNGNFQHTFKHTYEIKRIDRGKKKEINPSESFNKLVLGFILLYQSTFFSHKKMKKNHLELVLIHNI